MESNPFFDPPPKKKHNFFLIVLQSIVIFSAVSIILYLFVVTPNQVDGPSMEPNFYTYQLLLSNRLTQWIGNSPIGESLGLNYKRGDVVVFQKPGYKEFVKRVIGIPGDVVSISDGYVYINGQRMVEDYLPPALYTEGGDFIESDREGIVVPEGYYVCIGDNRPVSYDSRYSAIGLIDRNWMKGRVIIRFWPFEVFSLIPTGTYKLQNN